MGILAVMPRTMHQGRLRATVSFVIPHEMSVKIQDEMVTIRFPKSHGPDSSSRS